MSDEPLKVKFTWKRALRTRPVIDIGNVTVKNRKPSRSAKYVEKLKETDRTKYEGHLKRDAKRQKSEYVNITQQSTDDQLAQRQKWAETKKKQRQLKMEKKSEELEKLTSNKRFKDLNNEEKGEYYKLKRRASRNSKSRQKVVADQQKDRQRKRESRCGDAQVIPPNEPFTGSTNESLSKATLWRKTRTVQDVMPKSPEQYAQVVDNLIAGTPATPVG